MPGDCSNEGGIMSNLIGVNNPRDWPLDIPGVTVVPALSY